MRILIYEPPCGETTLSALYAPTEYATRTSRYNRSTTLSPLTNLMICFLSFCSLSLSLSLPFSVPTTAGPERVAHFVGHEGIGRSDGVTVGLQGNLRVVCALFIWYMCFSNAVYVLLSLFADALLADLQNTVPGHNQQQHGGGGGGGGSSVPGYGSLNGVRNKQQTSPVPVRIRHLQGCVRSTVISNRVLYEMYKRKHDNLEKKKK